MNLAQAVNRLLDSLRELQHLQVPRPRISVLGSQAEALLEKNPQRREFLQLAASVEHLSEVVEEFTKLDIPESISDNTDYSMRLDAMELQLEIFMDEMNLVIEQDDAAEQRGRLHPLERAIGKIDSNDDSGTYTITKQESDGSTLSAVGTDHPLYQVAARDIQNRLKGAAGDYVRFWLERKSNGEMEVLIDLTTTILWAKATDISDLSSKSLVYGYGCDASKGHVGTDLLTLRASVHVGVMNAWIVPDIAVDDLLMYVPGPGDPTTGTLLALKPTFDPQAGGGTTGGGIDKGIFHCIKINDNVANGTYEFSSDDWRGRSLEYKVYALYSASLFSATATDTYPPTSQWYSPIWNPGADALIWDGSDIAQVQVYVYIEDGTGHLYWKWTDADRESDPSYFMIWIDATQAKTEEDHEITA